MDGLGRPPKLTDELKYWIYNLLKRHTKRLKTPAIQDALRKYLQEVVKKEGKWKDEQINPEAEGRLPGKGTLQPYIKAVYAKLDKPNELDTAWHLHRTLDIPAEAISAIFKVQKLLDSPKIQHEIASIAQWTEMHTDGRLTTPTALTIREAQWIARLYMIEPAQLNPPSSTYLQDNGFSLVSNIYLLWYTAKAYADYQRLCEIAEIDFNSSRLDEGQRKGTIGEAKLGLFENFISEVSNHEGTYNTTE